MNCSWTIFGFIISSWTVHELMMNCSWTFIYVNFSWTIDELFMNYFFHNKFLNSSWTVMVNCSWTSVHEPTMRVFYEFFMNCSWTFMNVHEQFIKSWTTFHRGQFTFIPENYATFARSLTVIPLCDLFWYDLLSLPKVTGYDLYRTAPNKLIKRLHSFMF